jgi:hypothetical protein
VGYEPDTGIRCLLNICRTQRVKLGAHLALTEYLFDAFFLARRQWQAPQVDSGSVPTGGDTLQSMTNLV